MSVIPDFPDWQPHVATADQVAATGVPLLTKATVVTNQVITVPAASNQLTANFSVAQIGYEIEIAAHTAAGATIPFVTVVIQWLDSTALAVVGTDSFSCPASSSALNPAVTVGRGPTKADVMTVTIYNADPAQAIVCSLLILQNSRVYPRDEFFLLNNYPLPLVVPAWTLLTQPPDESVIGILPTTTIAAGTGVTRLTGIYNGPVLVGINMTAGALSSITVNLQALPNALYGSNNPVFGAVPPGSAFTVAGPRAPMRLVVNNTATTSVTLTMSLIRGQ